MTEPRTPGDDEVGARRIPDTGQDPAAMIAAGYARGVWGADADDLTRRMEAGEDPSTVLASVATTWTWVGDHARVLEGDYGHPDPAYDEAQPVLPGVPGEPWREQAARDSLHAASRRDDLEAPESAYATPEPVQDQDYARPDRTDERAAPDHDEPEPWPSYAEYEQHEPDRDEPEPVRSDRTW